jgi:oxygen-dependent protoporphyrinogen oxidase
MTKHVVVIGGGLAGTSAAHWLVAQGYRVTIIEQHERLGGRIHSHVVHGAAVEMGAGFLTKGYTNLWAFLEQSGLADRLYTQRGSTGVVRDGHITMVTPRTLAGSQLLSWGAKLQALPVLRQTLRAWRVLDPHDFGAFAQYDIRAVSEMFTGTYGKEFMERAIQPMLNGYFYWTPEHTSQAMLLLLCKAFFSHRTYRLQGGLQRIPETAAQGSTILLAHTVQTVEVSGTQAVIHVRHNGTLRTLTADGVVCATTASVVPKLFPHLTDEQKQFFAAVEYSSGALIARTYNQQATHGDKALVFPRGEGTDLSAVTVSPEPAAPGKSRMATVKTYASGTTGKAWGALSDTALTARLLHEMEPVRSAVLTNESRPVATHVQRWPEALPYFDVGHHKRLHAFEQGDIEDAGQPLVFAGDYLGGPFMEGAFTSGVQAAKRLHARTTALRAA